MAQEERDLIGSDYIEEELKIPVVRDDLIAYLNTIFDADSMLHNTRDRDAGYQVGYIVGVRDVIKHLKALQD